MESEQTINRQRRVFIIAFETPQMLHARLPGGIIDRGQHCDACFESQGGRRDGYGTLAIHAIGWLYPSFPLREGI